MSLYEQQITKQTTSRFKTSNITIQDKQRHYARQATSLCKTSNARQRKTTQDMDWVVLISGMSPRSRKIKAVTYLLTYQQHHYAKQATSLYARQATSLCKTCNVSMLGQATPLYARQATSQQLHDRQIKSLYARQASNDVTMRWQARSLCVQYIIIHPKSLRAILPYILTYKLTYLLTYLLTHSFT